MTEKCCIDDELRELLLQSDDEFRTEILKQAKSWVSGRNSHTSSDEWKSRLPELFSIWPKQMKAWSPKVLASFCGILLKSGDQFPFLLNLVINRLSKISPPYSINFYYLKNMNCDDEIIKFYQKELLQLLISVLPDDPRQWSSEMNNILEKLAKSDVSLETDERYIELKRRYST